MSKSILITGGSRGIGRATAVAAGARGWAVTINFRDNADAADETVRLVEQAGGQARAVRGDVTAEPDVLAMFDAAEDAFGPLDGVVNNAGIVAPSIPLAEMTLERIRRVLDTNVLGSFLVSREAARRLDRDRNGKGGALVNVSSAASRLGSPFEYVDYAASKGAMDTMTIGLAKELGPRGIRVNAVRPGLIETEIHASGGEPDRAERLGNQSPLGRPGTAQEVADTILFLLDDGSSYTTGALIDVAGGR